MVLLPVSRASKTCTHHCSKLIRLICAKLGAGCHCGALELLISINTTSIRAEHCLLVPDPIGSSEATKNGRQSRSTAVTAHEDWRRRPCARWGTRYGGCSGPRRCHLSDAAALWQLAGWTDVGMHCRGHLRRLIRTTSAKGPVASAIGCRYVVVVFISTNELLHLPKRVA